MSSVRVALRLSRIVANLVGIMLFVQVILGGSAVVLGLPIIYHLIWGSITFAVLVVTTILAVRDYGPKSTLFRVAIVAILDFVLQGILGLISFGSGPAVVVHLTNAFLLGVLVTYLISFADSAERVARSSILPRAQ
jgi:heme A synthase